MNKFTSTPKNSLNSKSKDTKIISFLKAVPHLEFTATGINNISKRFNIAPAHLTILIDFVSKGGGKYGN